MSPTPLLPIGMQSTHLRTEQPPPVEGRIAAMFEVRESDYNNELLFEAMIEQTYAPYRHNPWVAAVLEPKLDVMHAENSFTFRVRLNDDTVVDHEVLIERFRRPRATLVRFQLGPFVHVWSMSSAATSNPRGDNDFTLLLIQEVERVKPQVLIAANISRLVRSDQEGGLLLNKLPRSVDQVWAGSQILKLVGDGSEYGRMQFSILGSMASMEHTWLVTRMMAGKVAAWQRGQWLYGRNSVPFGYTLTPDRRLVPDVELRDKVREMLLILGADEAPLLTIHRLTELGVRLKSNNKPRRSTRASAGNPRRAVDRLLSLAPLYIAGERLWRTTFALKGTKELMGVPLVFAPGDTSGRGELQLLLTPGVPEGGWAEPAVLDQLALVALQRRAERERVTPHHKPLPVAVHVREASASAELHEVRTLASERTQPSSPRRRGTHTVAAFSGYAWHNDLGSFEIKRAAHNEYGITRDALPAPRLACPADGAPAARTPRKARHSPPSRSEQVAHIRPEELAHGFVRAFAEACTVGIAVDLTSRVTILRHDGRDIVLDNEALRRDQLENDLQTVHRRIGNTMASLEDASNEQLRKTLLKRAELLTAEAEAIERELNELNAGDATEEQVEFQSDVDVVLAALAAVASTRALTPEEYAAFHVIVPSMSLTRQDDGSWLAQAKVRLPVAGGVAELGPVTWTVHTRGTGVAAMRGARLSTTSAANARSAIELRDELRFTCGLDPVAARLLSVAPHAELAHLVLHERTGRPLPDWVGPEWRESDFIAHIMAVYGVPSGEWKGPDRYGRRLHRPQALVDLAAASGRLTVEEFLEAAPGATPPDMWNFARPKLISGALRAPVLQPHSIGPDVDGSVVNRTCRCGKPACIVVQAPEVPGLLLCECGLAVDAVPGSTADGVRFPRAYGDLRVRPEEWIQNLRQTFGPITEPTAEVIGVQARVLTLMVSTPERGWTRSELAMELKTPLKFLKASAAALTRRGFLGRDDEDRYALIDEALTRTVLDRSPSPRTKDKATSR